MNPLIFLDVDGVLNTRNGSLDADKLDLLRGVIQATSAHVVISSTWRHTEHQMARLRPELEKRGIAIVGKTPDASYRNPDEPFWVASTRATEILQWLGEHREYTNFVILDDAPFTQLKGWLVQTKSDVGLTPEHCEEIIRRLNPAKSPSSQTSTPPATCS